MKNVLFTAILVLTAGSAQAAPLTCNTNVDNNPRNGNTSVTINTVSADRVSVIEQTRGGMAHYITAPVQFDAHIQHMGPEVVQYTNAEQGFSLTVVFQPIGGKIRGTLSTELNGKTFNSPVVCAQAMN